MKFCANPLCRLHIETPETRPGAMIKYREANGNEVTVERKTIINSGTKKKFDLCAICAYVVALVNEK